MKKSLFLFSVVLFLCSGFIMSNSNKDNTQPNILFIEVDDLTAKYLGCFGADFAKTPHVDALAAQGVVFENMVVQGTMCGPSRNSLITGLYPHNIGFYANKELPQLPKDTWAFPKALQKEGYHTMWVGKNHIRPNTSGIKAPNPSARKDEAMQTQMGFDEVYQSAGRAVVLRTARKQAEKGKEWKKGKDSYGDFLYENNLLEKFVKEDGKVPTTLDPQTEYMDGHFTTKAINWLEKYKEEKPFFMWVNFSCPHGPFDVPQSYHDKFQVGDMPNIIDPATEQFKMPNALKPHPNKKSEKGTAKYRAGYSATINYMDEQLGRLVNYIRNSAQAENTVIVFFSDHGLMTGDHGLVHKGTLYKEILNPALIVSFPKKYKAKRVKTPTELLDLGKTVLDIAGANAEEINACPNGHSLLPLLSGQGKYTGTGTVFSEIDGFRSAYDGSYKYIDNEEMPILFKLTEDGDETNNFVKKDEKNAKRLQKDVVNWIEKSGAIKKAGFYKKEKKKKTTEIKKTKKVFLFAGQSNMEGRADAAQLSDVDMKRLEKSAKNIQFHYNRKAVSPLQLTTPQKHTQKKFNLEKSFGPELFFGINLAEKHPDEEFIFIKRSKGGTSLHGCWNPDWTEEKAALMNEANAPKLYSDFIAYAKEILAEYEPDEYEIVGMLWVQGEADSGVKKHGEIPSASYHDNLQNLISGVRKEFDSPNLPFVMFQVGNGKVVKGMQAKAASDANVYLIPQNRRDKQSPDYYEKNPPPVGHYIAASMKRIGENFFKIFDMILK